jgi:YD repeat-containing protein
MCATPTSHADDTNSFEADLRYGAFVLRQTDLSLKDVFDVPLTRTYTSQDWASDNPVHAYGQNANHPYDIAPRGDNKRYTYLTLMLEDSDFLYFKRISKGTGYRDAVFMHTETSTLFSKATIAWNGNGWTLHRTDGTEIHFPESYRAGSLAKGAALDWSDAAGSKLILRRDNQRNLREILTPHGHWIRFEQDNQGRITEAIDDRANSVQYGYNRDGMLIYARRSSDMSLRYEYDGSEMTTVSDDQGRILVRNWYESNVLIAQQFANRDIYKYRYIWYRGMHFADRVVITLPDHSEKEISLEQTVPDYVRTRK